MRRILAILISLVPLSSLAQDTYNTSPIAIREVSVWGRRPMKEIGVEKTALDSVSLRENISLSMADVLTFNSSIFVKSWGRATLSTVAFRGTSASHTQVTWNGMKINSPMLGMTDFSMIPSHFVDQATIFHGTSSINETGGGLGGAVRLQTAPVQQDGFNLEFVQGYGSFKTVDDYLRLTYGSAKWQSSTRLVFSYSPNRYPYRNRDKKENIYDSEHNIIGQYYPWDRNRSGSFRDLHLLQEFYYNTLKGDRLGLSAWFISSNRELQMLTTDYADDTKFDNRQREHTLRAVLSWDHLRPKTKLGLKAGYIHTWMAYDYKRDLGNSVMAHMTRSRSKINTLYAQGNFDYSVCEKLYLTASIDMHQHFVRSADKNVIMTDGDRAIVGYDKGRVELSGAASLKWRPSQSFGAALTLREEMYRTTFSPVIPALFLDGLLSRRGNITWKASASRNFRYPTLNDLYFVPGGNPSLKPEKGWSYDVGLGFEIGRSTKYKLQGSVCWFDSYIRNWILWLPTTKGFFSPKNIREVHAYGVEGKLSLALRLSADWNLAADANVSYTPSINRSEQVSAADRSAGKQLPYVPKYSASINGRLAFRLWEFSYRWCYYSRRYTMSSNDRAISGSLPPYLMSNISLSRQIGLRWADLSCKIAVNNLFNEEYLSVLSRPMPGINYEIYVSIKPKWHKKRK